MEIVIAAAITGGLGIVLTFIFTRNREVSDMARKNIQSTRLTFDIIETLRTVAFLQGQRIDRWENWGSELAQVLDGKMHDLNIPEMPDMHLDLRPYWRDIDNAIEEMAGGPAGRKPNSKMRKDDE